MDNFNQNNNQPTLGPDPNNHPEGSPFGSQPTTWQNDSPQPAVNQNNNQPLPQQPVPGHSNNLPNTPTPNSNSEDTNSTPPKKTTWSWSLIIIVVVLLIAIIVGGLYGILSGKRAGEAYQNDAKKYLSALSLKIEKSKSAKDINVSIKAINQPPLPESFMGGLSSTYRKARSYHTTISDTVSSMRANNNLYINMNTLVVNVNKEQEVINSSALNLKDISNEVERRNELIALEQSCKRLEYTIRDYKSVPNFIEPTTETLIEDYNKTCATVNSLNDAHIRDDKERITKAINELGEDVEVSAKTLATLTKKAEATPTNKQEYIKQLQALEASN